MIATQSRVRDYNLWSEEDVNLLKEYWGKYSVGYISEKLGRSEKAISHKRQQLNLIRFTRSSDYISFNEFGDLMGIAKASREILVKKGLPIHLKLVNTSRTKIVKINEFWKWAENNKTIIDFSRLERNILGPEPEWVKEKRKIDFEFNQILKKHGLPWSKSDDNYLISLLKLHKFNSLDLTLKFERTEDSIRRRILDLKIKERPVRVCPKLWTDEEIKIVVDLYKRSYHVQIISLKLNRTASSIQERIKKMIKDGELEQR